MTTKAPHNEIAIVDLFAGPGGLGEGFSVPATDTLPAMRIRLSIESDPIAVQTLRLRAFLRNFHKYPQEYYDALNSGVSFPNWREKHPKIWNIVEGEVRELELGKPGVFESVTKALDEIRKDHTGNTILIGGPPCQAYSLVGRSRNMGKENYSPEKDERHFLYQEYVRILNYFRPTAFVMENVKGMLSSKVGGGPIFERIVADLQQAAGGYHLLPMTAATECLTRVPPARDFLVRSEQHGVPQARHRVFLIGIKRSCLGNNQTTIPPILPNTSGPPVPVLSVLGDLPKLRSGMSRNDNRLTWSKTITAQADRIIRLRNTPEEVRSELQRLKENGLAILQDRLGTKLQSPDSCIPPALADYLYDPRLSRLQQHETRGHMKNDLCRYLYATVYARVFNETPRLEDFPWSLRPKHANRDSGHFTDRFRVQLFNRPSSTITSHICKDGHYYIHPDPLQWGENSLWSKSAQFTRFNMLRRS